MALNPSNSSNLKQLVLKGLIARCVYCTDFVVKHDPKSTKLNLHGAGIFVDDVSKHTSTTSTIRYCMSSAECTTDNWWLPRFSQAAQLVVSLFGGIVELSELLWDSGRVELACQSSGEMLLLAVHEGRGRGRMFGCVICRFLDSSPRRDESAADRPHCRPTLLKCLPYSSHYMSADHCR